MVRDETQDDAPRSWKKAWPFFVAAGVAVIGVVAILVSNVIRSPEERLSEDAKAIRAVSNYYGAMGTVRYTEFRDLTCVGNRGAGFPSEAEFEQRYGDQRREHGPITVTDLTTSISGDTGTADVRWRFDTPGDEVNEKVTLARQDGEWRVCK